MALKKKVFYLIHGSVTDQVYWSGWEE